VHGLLILSITNNHITLGNSNNNNNNNKIVIIVIIRRKCHPKYTWALHHNITTATQRLIKINKNVKTR
jgi:hypothetical protein